jgi:hypothetical protein
MENLLRAGEKNGRGPPLAKAGRISSFPLKEKRELVYSGRFPNNTKGGRFENEIDF